MAVIGNAPQFGNITIANDAFNGDASTTVFTLSQNVGATADIEVIVDNVQQSPYDGSYSVAGTSLTFSTAPAAGSNNVYVIYNFARTATTQQVIPDDGSVTSAKIANGAVEAAMVTPFGMRNRIINGDMRIDQRNAGTAITTHNSHPVDRFKNGFANMSTGTFTSQQSTTAPDGFTSSVVYTAGAADSLTANSYAFLIYHIEGYDFANMNFGATSAKTVTLSFWARSSLTGLFGVALRNGPPYDRSYIASYTISSANTWEYKTITIPGCTTGTWDKSNAIGASVFFDLGIGTTYSGSATGAWENANLFGLTGGIKIQQTAGATLYITGLQLEKGSVATPFEHRPYGTELALCQRYYHVFKHRIEDDAASNGKIYFGGASFPTQMRTTPTATTSYTASNLVNTGEIHFRYRENYSFIQGIRETGSGTAYADITNTFSAEL